MRENPVIPDWVHVSGGNTEGLLGGRLAQRQAALRGLLAAGARSTLLVFPCVPSLPRARCVPLAESLLVLSHRDLSLQRNRFLIFRIDVDRARSVLGGFRTIASLQKYPAE